VTTKRFVISKREGETRISSTIQHKLRVVLKCYTIKNFNVNQEENTFTFNKTNRIRGIVINDKKLYSGSFQIVLNDNLIEDKEYILIITIN
jgi:hypothetical protein